MGWAQPIFFWFWAKPRCRLGLRGVGSALIIGELLQRTLPALGYELVDVEASRGGLVRVFIDKPAGIDVEDCARGSNHLTRLFAVENIDFDRLEVSSPRLDPPLTKLADFARFAG